MRLASFRHKGLRELYEDGNSRNIPATMADKLAKLLLGMDVAHSLDDLRVFPGWRLHALQGDWKGFWSLTVTGNWRLLFRYDKKTNTVSDVDLIDYH